MKVPPVVHFLGKNVIRLFLVLIFVGVPVTAIYLREVGIGFGAKEALARALSSEAIHVSIGRLAFDPFSGLLAEKVLIREAVGRERPLAKLSDVSVSLNMSELTSGRIKVDRLSLSRASVSLPIAAESNARRIEFEDVNAEVILLGDQLRLSRFEGVFERVRIVLSGQFLNPDAVIIPSRRGQQQESQQEVLGRVLEELSSVQYPGSVPILRADIEADLAKPDSLTVSNASFRAGRIVGNGWALRDVEVSGEYANGILRIPRFIVRDERGSLELSAEWTTSSGSFDVAILSTIHPGQFLKLLEDKNPLFKDVRFGESPQIEARVVGESSSGRPAVRVTGMALFPEVLLKSVPFRNAGFSFAWKDGTFYGRDVRLSAKRGDFAGAVWIAPNDIRLDATTTIPATELQALFDPKTREFISRMEFKDLPDIQVAIRAPKLDFSSLRGQGRFKLGRTAMRGAWLDSAEANFEIGDRCVTYRNFLVRRGEGKGTGSFAYDVGRQEARLYGIRSTMVPSDVLMWIDPKIAEAVVPYRFRSPPSVAVDGMVHLKDATKNNLSIGIESAAGLEYDLLKRTLPFGKTSAQVNVVGTKVRANVKRAAFMGGDTSLKAIVSIDAKDPTFGVDVQLNRVNFAQLTKLYFDYDDSKGVMSGKYKFDALQGRENLMRGSGSIRIEDGNVFAIPVLGPFSEILGTLLPGVGYQTARVATADFSVANEVINTKNLLIEGAGFSMIGAGDIFFMTSRLDMSMRVNAKGIPGLVFYPVSKLFEYVSTGTVADPGWRPKIIPRIDSDGEGTPPKPGRR
ncbi:MAG: hypothetical protein ACOYNN_02935 [Terrimicrobiaceae bacterium]